MKLKGGRHTDKTPELAKFYTRLSLPSDMYINKHAIKDIAHISYCYLLSAILKKPIFKINTK